MNLDTWTTRLTITDTDKQVRRLKKTYELLSDITKQGSFEYYDGEEVRKRLNCPHIKGAIYEPETGILDPSKHVRSLKKLAEREGAEIYENTKVIGISRDKTSSVVQTDDATIKAKKLVIATNAWTHTLKKSPKVANVQAPVWTYQIVTEPLTPEQWKSINWGERMSIEDNRQLVHYTRITKCGRITMGEEALVLNITIRKWICGKTKRHGVVWKNI